jgi:hypothetical protein
MKTTRHTYPWLCIIILVFVIHSCKDNSTGSNENQQITPVITSVVPESGKFGEPVTITGSNFSATLSENTVTFNGVGAVVTHASLTLLTVEVPNGAGAGPIEVNVGGQTGMGPEFDYLLTITVSTYAGTGAKGYVDGDAASAQFYQPSGIVLDSDGNLFVADRLNDRIRKITPQGQVTTFAGSTEGYADGMGTNAKFTAPMGLAMTASSEIYVADYVNQRIRKISSADVVSTLAGSLEGYLNRMGTNAFFSFPIGLDVDTDGNIYVADRNNHRIRKINSSAEVTTLTGDGTEGYTDGSGANAQFNDPFDVSVMDSGEILVADHDNNVIRQVAQNGVVNTFAGTGIGDFSDGPLSQASFRKPSGIDIDDNGIIYIADQNNHSIRMIYEGEVTTIAGDGTYGYIDGDGAEARFYLPWNLVSNSDGSIIYVTDAGNNVIRKITLE